VAHTVLCATAYWFRDALWPLLTRRQWTRISTTITFVIPIASGMHLYCLWYHNHDPAWQCWGDLAQDLTLHFSWFNLELLVWRESMPTYADFKYCLRVLCCCRCWQEYKRVMDMVDEMEDINKSVAQTLDELLQTMQTLKMLRAAEEKAKQEQEASTAE